MSLAEIPFLSGMVWSCVRIGRWELRDRRGGLAGYAERAAAGRWLAYAAGSIVSEDCGDFDEAKKCVEHELTKGSR